MSNLLVDIINEGVKINRPVIWLDADDYAVAVIRNNKPIPWCSPTECVNSYLQIQDLLKSSVVSINISAFFESWLSNNLQAKQEMSGKKRVRFAFKRLISMEQPRQIVRDIVSALCSSLIIPVVLHLPQNDWWINWANQQANGADPQQLTDVDIDSASVYIADFLRIFSGIDLSGVLVDLPNDVYINENLLDLYSPIINVARHYKWALGFNANGDVHVNHDVCDADFLIGDYWDSDSAILDKDFWQKGCISGVGKKIYYGRIPESLEPEIVLERIGMLRIQSK